MCKQKIVVVLIVTFTLVVTSRYFAQKLQNGVLAGYEAEKTQIR